MSYIVSISIRVISQDVFRDLDIEQAETDYI